MQTALYIACLDALYHACAAIRKKATQSSVLWKFQSPVT